MSKYKKIAIIIFALLLVALPWILNPYILQIVIGTISLAILGLAFMLSMKVGLIRFDIAGWFGVGAYTSILLTIHLGMPFWLTIPIAGLVAVVLGWLIYIVPMGRGMLTFFVFSMLVSMAFFQLFGSVAFFGGWTGTKVVDPPSIGSFVFSSKESIYYLGIVFFALVITVLMLLYKSKIGRAWSAIQSSTKLASSVGINVLKYRMANVLIGNFIIAMTGCFFIAFARVATPASFGFGISMNMMMYAVIGGIFYSISGPIIGSLIFSFIPEYFRIAKSFAPILTSAVVILIIIFMPMGILGLINMRLLPWVYRTKLYANLKRKFVKGNLPT